MSTSVDAAVAPVDAPAVDAPADPAPFNCATSPTSGTHKLFLAFDGLTLNNAAPTDATQNNAAYLPQSKTTAVIPVWKDGVADRAAQIQTIQCRIRESLYPYDVEVVTTRPASGDYEMVVFGGRPADLGFSSTMSGMSSSDCANTNTRDLTWVPEHPGSSDYSMSAHESAAYALSFIGGTNGLVPSIDVGNCTCVHSVFQPASCNQEACAFTAAAKIDPEINYCLAPGTTQNQVEKLKARYGARF